MAMPLPSISTFPPDMRGTGDGIAPSMTRADAGSISSEMTGITVSTFRITSTMAIATTAMTATTMRIVTITAIATES